MRFLYALLLVAYMFVGRSPVVALPTTTSGTHVTGPISTPFDPPINTPTRYLFEKIQEKDGKSTRSWTTYDAVFAERPEGYRLTITPIDSGNDRERDKMSEAIYKRLNRIENRPFVVEIGDDLRISGIVDIDRLWNEIVTAVRETAKDPALGKKDRDIASFTAEFLLNMPKEARLAKLLEPVQPLVEFAGVQIDDASKPIPFETETASPLGGKIKMDGTISVLKADDAETEFAIVSQISRESLDAMLKVAVGQTDKHFGNSQPQSQPQLDKIVAALNRFEIVDRANYRLATENGMLIAYTNARSTVVKAQGESGRIQATWRLTRQR